MTTLDATLASLIEQAIARAFERVFPAGAPPAVVATAPDGEITAAKKPRASKKANAAEAPTSDVVTTMPLPAPVEPPSQAKPSDVETDRARLMTLTTKIPDGRKVATELIRQHGQKFDGLPADTRALVIAALEQLALPAEVA